MKDLIELLNERLKLNKDTKISKNQYYLVFPIWDDYNMIKKDYKGYITISYGDKYKDTYYFEIFIFSEEYIDRICDDFNYTNNPSTIWELPEDFDYDEFREWFSDKSNNFEHFDDIINEINKKYKFKVIEIKK